MKSNKRLTLAEWFLEASGGKLTWSEYKKNYNEDEYVSAIAPSDIKRIWNAGAKSGKVSK